MSRQSQNEERVNHVVPGLGGWERKKIGTDRCPASKGKLGLPARLRSSLPFLPSKPLLFYRRRCIYCASFVNLHLREALFHVIQFSILRTAFQPLSVWLNFRHVSDDGQFCDLGQVPARVVCSRHLVSHQLYCLFESVYSLLTSANSWGAGGLTLNHIFLSYTFNTPLGFLTLLLFTRLQTLP